MGDLKKLHSSIRYKDKDVLTPTEAGWCPLEYRMRFEPSSINIKNLCCLIEQECASVPYIKKLIEARFKKVDFNLSHRAIMKNILKVPGYNSFVSEVVEMLRFARGYRKLFCVLPGSADNTQSEDTLEEKLWDVEYLYKQEAIRKRIIDGTIKSPQELLRLGDKKHKHSLKV